MANPRKETVAPYELPVVAAPVKDLTETPIKARTKVEHPWEEIPPEAIQTYVVDLPAQLHCKLKWLGGMTWGSSMRKIVVAALEAEAERLLKAKGIGK